MRWAYRLLVFLHSNFPLFIHYSVSLFPSFFSILFFIFISFVLSLFSSYLSYLFLWWFYCESYSCKIMYVFSYFPSVHPQIYLCIYQIVDPSIYVFVNPFLSLSSAVQSSSLLFSSLLYCSLLIASLLFTSHLVSLICFSSHLISLTLFSSLVFFSSKDAAPQDVGTPPITTGTETTPGGGRNKYGSMNPINASATSFMQGSGQPGKKGLHSSKVRMTLKLFHMHVSLS